MLARSTRESEYLRYPMRRLRVVHVGPSPSARGGIASVIRRLVDVQRRDPYLEVGSVATMEGPGRRHKLRAAIRGMHQVYRMLRDRPRDLVLHVHAASRASMLRKSCVVSLAHHYEVPVILHAHGGGLERFFTEGSHPYRRIVLRTLRLADRRVAVSGELARQIEVISGRGASVVYNGIDVDAFRTHPRSSAGPFKILYLGRVCEPKGIYVLLEAFRELTRETEGGEYQLLIAGEGETDAVRRRAREQGTQDDVKILGWLDPESRTRALRTADVLVLPSTQLEAFGLALIQAMAAELPVIATRVGGVPEIVQDGTTGVLVPPRDPHAIAHAVARLARDEAERRRLADNGLEKVRRDFDQRTWADEIKRLYIALHRGAHLTT